MTRFAIRHFLLTAVQRVFNTFGFQIRRLKAGVDLDDAMSEQLRLAGPDIRVIFEIGAADGRDCVTYAERCPNALIHAYEPLPKNFAALEEKAAAVPAIKPTNMAMSDQPGQATFFETALGDASSLFRPQETGSSVDKYIEVETEHQVDVTTLDMECAAKGVDHIDLLKLDVQGAELSVFTGAARMLSEKRIGVIYSEVQFRQLYEGTGLYHDVARFLSDHGYRLHNLYDLKLDQHGRLAWGDAIFVPADQAPSV